MFLAWNHPGDNIIELVHYFDPAHLSFYLQYFQTCSVVFWLDPTELIFLSLGEGGLGGLLCKWFCGDNETVQRFVLFIFANLTVWRLLITIPLFGFVQTGFWPNFQAHICPFIFQIFIRESLWYLSLCIFSIFVFRIGIRWTQSIRASLQTCPHWFLDVSFNCLFSIV